MTSRRRRRQPQPSVLHTHYRVAHMRTLQEVVKSAVILASLVLLSNSANATAQTTTSSIKTPSIPLPNSSLPSQTPLLSLKRRQRLLPLIQTNQPTRKPLPIALPAQRLPQRRGPEIMVHGKRLVVVEFDFLPRDGDIDMPAELVEVEGCDDAVVAGAVDRGVGFRAEKFALFEGGGVEAGLMVAVVDDALAVRFSLVLDVEGAG